MQEKSPDKDSRVYAIFDEYPLPAAVLDQSNNVIYVNGAAQKLCTDNPEAADLTKCITQQLLPKPAYYPHAEGILPLGNQIFLLFKTPHGSNAILTFINITRESSLETINGLVRGQLTVFSGGLADTSTELSTLNTRIDSLAKETANRAESVAESSKSVQGKIRELSASVDVSNEKLRAIIDNVAHSSRIADEAIARGEQAVRAVEGLQKLHESISHMSTVFDGMMSNSKVLSINAAIEAARAGTYGRGFSIIAKNISEFSEKTRSLSRDIRDTVQKTTQELTTVIDGMTHVSTVIKELQTISSGTRDAAASQTDQMAKVSKEIQSVDGASNDVIHKMELLLKDSDMTSSEVNKSIGLAAAIHNTSDVIAIYRRTARLQRRYQGR